MRVKPYLTAQQQPYTTRGFDSSSPGSARTGVFSQLEIRDIILAWLALSAAFLVAQRGMLVLGGGLATNIAVSIVAVGSGFVLHELMHKFTAQRYGYWAEFKMWPFGIVFALLTSVVGFIFAAPGATYIKPVRGFDVPARESGIISLAGPATNIIVGLLFLPLLLLGNPIYQQAGRVGLSINYFLAAFNMLPMMPLDGAKVFRWNKILWGVIFVPLAVVVAIFLGLVRV
jgi:Zn-dependent protease